MAPDKIVLTSSVDMGTYTCVATPLKDETGTPCNLYPKTHTHYEKAK